MLKSFKKLFSAEKQTFSRKQSLRGVPVVKTEISSQEGPGGERILFIPRQNLFGEFLRRFLPTDVAPARVVLDEMGNSVWKLIDGKRNVGQITRLFGGEWGLHPREAETSVASFLNMLMKRGIILIVIR